MLQIFVLLYALLFGGMATDQLDYALSCPLTGETLYTCAVEFADSAYITDQTRGDWLQAYIIAGDYTSAANLIFFDVKG